MTATTNNPAYGFWGTIRYHAKSEEAWPLAMSAVAAATGRDDAAVRDFLDSRAGRHFADEVSNHLVGGKRTLAEAIDVAVARWLAWDGFNWQT